jgi:hypothetical protein
MNTTEILLKTQGETLEQIVGLITGMDQKFTKIEARFEKMDRRFVELEDKMSVQFDKVGRRFVELEDKMLTRFDFLEGKIFSLEKNTEMGFLGIQNQLDNIAINHVPIRAHTLLESRVKKIERKVGSN